MRMDMHTRLREARERAGFEDAASAARRYGWGETTYRSHENGQRQYKIDRARDYGRAFRVSPEWLLLGNGDDRRKPVPLVGYVGAGAEMFSADDGGALDEIDPPPGIGPSAVAVRVRGDSMFPRYMDGDMLIYDAHTPIRKADGQECVVALPDGRRFVKIVRDERDGTVTLESWNAPPIRRIIVEWVAPIVWVKRG
jgi:phage repressor protein C with HTH and peptisase S24 domain